MASQKHLSTFSRKELAQMAKHHKVEGWHDMKKADLIGALKTRPLVKPSQKSPAKERVQSLRAKDSRTNQSPLRRTSAQSAVATSADRSPQTGGALPVRLLANTSGNESATLHASAFGSHWIYASWRLTPRILDRAEASLGANWHTARPVLHVIDVSRTQEGSPSKCCLTKIPLQTPIDHWYVPIADSGRTYELQLGYETPRGQFFMLARSVSVKLPAPGSQLDRQYDEQRQDTNRQKSTSGSGRRFPIRGSSRPRFSEDVTLEINADLVILGRTSTNSVTCLEDQAHVQDDGRFEIRLTLEEGRHVIPLEAVSADGSQSQTVVLAIERNTKSLAPQELNDWD